jgi:DNA repair exonuclease SbcCD ATPase subunit
LFEQLFDIDTSGQYKRLRMIETSMTLAKAKMAALMESAGNVTWIRAVNDLEASISRIERELAALRPEFEKSQAYLAIERSAEDALDRHPELEGLGLEGLQARLAQVDPRALTEELATASVLRKQSEDYERFSRAFIACENVPVVISDFVEAFCQTEQETESFLSLCKILKRIDSIPEPPERFDTRKIEHDLHAAERKLASLEHAKECPTCGASLRTGAKGIVAAIRKEIAILSDELSVAQSADAEYRRYSNVYEHDVFLVAGYSDIKRLHAHIDDALAVIEFLRTPTVARPKLTPRSEADIRSDLNACMDLSRAIDELIRFCKTEEPQVIVNEREIVNLETRRDTLKEQLLEARVKHRSWSELTRDAARYAMQCRNLDVVSVLKDMYGPKGLRLARIKDAAQAYVDNLNRVSGLAFTNYKFAADVSDSGIVITCERPSGVSDIRRFSGAEGKLLPILSLLALHDILPDAHKSNVLILDEVEAGMRRDTRQRYVDLLPELQAIYPSLWIVTPLQRSEFDVILPECDVIEHTVRMSSGKAIVETET